MRVSFDASEMTKLGEAIVESLHAADLSAARMVAAEARKIEDDWYKDAKAKARRHGKHYPSSLRMNLEREGFLHIVGEVAPDPSKKQGNMSFEFGSRNQRPHLSGQKASQASDDRFPREVRRWVEDWAGSW